MSSLLDILHRRQEPLVEPAPVAEAPVDPAEPTLELRLAVDNGSRDAASWTEPEPGPEVDTTSPWPETALAPPAPQPVLEVASPEPAPVPRGATGPVVAPVQVSGTGPAAGLPPAPATVRARRSTWLLAGGLGAIVAVALLAAWALKDVMGPAEDSMFVAAPPAPAAPAETAAPTGGVVARTPDAASDAGNEPAPTVAPAREARGADAAAEPEAPLAPAPEALLGGEPDWYDAPAVDEAGAAPASAPEPEPAAIIRITRGTTETGNYPRLQEAWTAFQAGDLAGAEALYRQVLATDPASVDAHLGLAAVAARNGLLDEARNGYNEVLRLDPRNSAAVAALSMLPAAPAATRSESELKTLLRDQPDAAQLHFALGLRYLSLGRWPDAQGAFFEAVRCDPANADYAFNLAVSLDRLGQKSAAASYYERALALNPGTASFDRVAAGNRLARLRAPAP